MLNSSMVRGTTTGNNSVRKKQKMDSRKAKVNFSASVPQEEAKAHRTLGSVGCSSRLLLQLNIRLAQWLKTLDQKTWG